MRTEQQTSAIPQEIKQGLEHHNAGRLSEAERIYREILLVDPINPDALHLLGLIAHQVGKNEDSVYLIDRAIQYCPSNPYFMLHLGAAYFGLRRMEEALENYDKALMIMPECVEALNDRGVALQELKRFGEALTSFEDALAVKPDYAEALSNRGMILHELKRYDEALASYDRALAIKSEYAEASNNRGNTLQKLGRYNDALVSYDKALTIKNNYVEALSNRGNTLQALGRYEEAVASYQKALTIKSGDVEALTKLGNALHKLRKYDDALASYNKALAINEEYADAQNNRGAVLQDLKRFEEALTCYDKVLILKPDFPEALSNRGVLLQEFKRHDEALANLDKALSIKPDYAEAHSNRGVVLHDLKRFREALASYDRALSIRPEYAEALSNRGVVLQDLRRYDEALADYDKALIIKPDYADALSNRGNALQALGRFDEAIASFDRAITIKPDLAAAFANRGTVLQELNRHNDAIASYEKALAIKHDTEFLYGTLLYERMRICNWDNSEIDIAELAKGIRSGAKLSSPFPLVAVSSSPELQQQAAKIWVQAMYPESREGPRPAMLRRRNKICIGYFSADFHTHATAYLIAELFERHERSKFELIAFSFGPDTGDEMRRRLTSSFDRFVDVRTKSDRDVALLAREFGVDIAVDLKGFTKDSRPGIFASRAGPLQVAYLGYPGTMGADYIDYLIADHTLIPEFDRKYYTEKIVYLPDSYQVNDARRQISDKPLAKADVGLPGTGFVFCCFNNDYKIRPEIFNCWMQILLQVKGSVLWLYEDNPQASSNLRNEASRRGVSAERLVFAKRMPFPEHLARHRLADLFLDTLPCNAHTTASDALWAGLPVLTHIGTSFAGRVAASLLNAIDLPELIASTQESYEALAVELATNSKVLNRIKRKLEANRLKTSLFDIQRFTRHLEAAYMAMYERHHSGLPPDHIYVRPQ